MTRATPPSNDGYRKACTCRYTEKIRQRRPIFNDLYARIEFQMIHWREIRSNDINTRYFEETYLQPILTALFSIDVLVNESSFESKTDHVVRMLLASALVDLPNQRSRRMDVPREMHDSLLRDLHAASEIMKSLQKPWGRLEDVVCFHHAFLSPNGEEARACKDKSAEYRTGTERVAYCGTCLGEIRPPDAVPSRQRNIAQSFLNDKARMVILRALDSEDPFDENETFARQQSSLTRTNYLQATIQGSASTYTLQRSSAEGSHANFREWEPNESLHAMLDPLRCEHRRAFQDTIRLHADTLYRSRTKSLANAAVTLARLHERLEDLERTSSSRSSSWASAPESASTDC